MAVGSNAQLYLLGGCALTLAVVWFIRRFTGAFEAAYWKAAQQRAWRDTREAMRRNWLTVDVLPSLGAAVASFGIQRAVAGNLGMVPRHYFIIVISTIAGWVLSALVTFLYYFNAAPSCLAKDEEEAAAKRESDLRAAVAERDGSLAAVSSRLAGVENSRPRLELTATWIMGHVPPWPRGKRDQASTRDRVAAKAGKPPTILVVDVANRPVVSTPQAVAMNIGAAVAFFDGDRCTHSIGGAWLEGRAEEYDPDGWLPHLSADPVTIEPGRVRRLVIFIQHAGDFVSDKCIYGLDESSCNYLGWKNPAYRIRTDPVRIVVRVQGQWECLELELTATAGSAPSYGFDGQVVRQCG